MNKVIYISIIIIAFLTAKIMFLLLPVMWWVFKDEKKRNRRVFLRPQRRF